MAKRYDSDMNLNTLSDTELDSTQTEVQAEVYRMRTEIERSLKELSERGEETSDWHRRLTCANRHMNKLLKRICIEKAARRKSGQPTFAELFVEVAREKLGGELFGQVSDLAVARL